MFDPALGICFLNFAVLAVALIAYHEHWQIFTAILAAFTQPHVQSVESGLSRDVEHDDESLGLLIEFIADFNVLLVAGQVPHVEVGHLFSYSHLLHVEVAAHCGLVRQTKLVLERFAELGFAHLGVADQANLVLGGVGRQYWRHTAGSRHHFKFKYYRSGSQLP